MKLVDAATRKGVAARPVRDWEAIETLYRAGALSIREIAKAHGLSNTAIHQRAKAHGWVRNLTAKVQDKVRTELLRSQVSTRGSVERPVSEKEMIEEAAATVVEVVRGHRRGLKAALRIAAHLQEQLEDTVLHRNLIEDDIIEDTAGDKTGERRYRMLRAVALGANMVTFKDFTLAVKNVIAMERQAFGMADVQDGSPAAPDAVADHRDDDERFKRLEDRLEAVSGPVDVPIREAA